MTKPKPNPRPSSPTASLFGWAGGFVFVKETINLWCKLLSPLGRFYAGVILGFLGMLGFKRRQKGVFRLAATDHLLIPIQCEYYALESLGNLLSTIRRIQMAFNSALTILGILRTMYDARTNLAPQVSAELQKHFPQWLLRTVIPRTVRLAEAPSHGLPIIYFPLDGSEDVPR